MIELVATGRTNTEIAERLGFSEGAVSAIRSSPLFQQEVADAQSDMKAHALHYFAERVAEETVPSLQKLAFVRDKEGARDADVINASDKIIGYALDLYVGRKNGEERRTMKVVIDGADLKGLMDAAKEVRAHTQPQGEGAIEVEAARPGTDDQAPAQAQDDASAASEGRIRPMTIQEFLDAEAQADAE